MTLFKHELNQGKTALLVWAGAVAFLMAACVLIYPEMAAQMGEISQTFSRLGGFSTAFGMDQISFGEFMGFFSVECGNVLGLGGAFFAALVGISALAKEEKGRTAEFLLTHPLSRGRIVTEKLLAVEAQVVLFNGLVAGITLLAIALVGEAPDGRTLGLLLFSHLLLQLELAAVCFGLSAFLRRGGLGLGLGLAAILYFLNLMANLTQGARFLKYLTPFSYTEGAAILTHASLEKGYLAAGMAWAALGIAAAFAKYLKKDIA